MFASDQHWYLAIAVLANNEGVHAARVYAKMLAEQVPEARGVEDRTRPDQPLCWQPGELERRIGQCVHRIGGNQKDAVGIVSHDLRNNLPPNLAVAHDHVKPSLARPLACAGSEHGNGVPAQSAKSPAQIRVGCTKGMAWLRSIASPSALARLASIRTISDDSRFSNNA